MKENRECNQLRRGILNTKCLFSGSRWHLKHFIDDISCFKSFWFAADEMRFSRIELRLV